MYNIYMTNNGEPKSIWDINYAYDDSSEEEPKKPVLGIVPPVARGTRAHESRTILPEEKPVLPLPTKSEELDKDEIARLTATTIIPGTPPKKS